MKTDVITVSSRGSQMEAALEQVELVARYKNLSEKSSLHLRLLAEETLGMMRSITGETEGQFWIEDADGEFQLHLVVETRMNSEKRGQLLSAASSGRNESARGLMGRIRDFFDRGADEDVATLTAPMFMGGAIEPTASHAMDVEWSMTQYQNSLAQRVEENDEEAKAAWDEMEKSVVTHVADDIRVSIRGPRVEMIIIKKMA